MKYVEVTVNAPGGHLHSFSYSVPPTMEVEAGQAVWVPFGSKTVQGVILLVSTLPAYAETRDISGPISFRPLISQERIKLASWIAGYYFAPLFSAVELMLPPGFKRKVVTYVSLVNSSQYAEPEEDLQNFVIYIKGKGGSVNLADLKKTFGARQAEGYIKPLISRGIVKTHFDLEAERVKPRLVGYYRLQCTIEEALCLAEQLRTEKLSDQADVLELMVANGGKLPLSALRDNKKVKRSALKYLGSKGVLEVVKLEVKRDPLAARDLPLELPLAFTDEQQTARDKIVQALHRSSAMNQSKVILLHGITGSGKTEIYLNALAATVSLGKKGICLVPEIALTPQMIERFCARFPGKVAVLHSGLTLGQQYDQWYSINRGEYDVVIGSRSAIFAPQPNLGLIIVDEEHEWAYKQSDSVPRYHARDVAIKLAESCGSVLILGSATPDVQTYYRGQAGEYEIIELKSRAGFGNVPQLPDVSIVDMKTELKSGNRGLFSRLLQSNMISTIQENRQTILYINRRGQSTIIKCEDCGYIFMCNRCSAPLTYHSSGRQLVCHHCYKNYGLPVSCKACNSTKIKYLGAGTERVEYECARLFPAARIIRFDSDAVTGIKNYEKIVRIFKHREADILIGTQMLAKGLDFPHVTLVGIINADIGLTLPDFRSAERIFQLLCQVSGRAGRGLLAGRSVIQTYNPAHYAIKYAAAHDYAGFYESEINFRRELGYPPFSQMLRMVYNHSNREKSLMEAEAMLNRVKARANDRGITDLKIVGPIPAFYARLRGKYLTQIIIFGKELNTLIRDTRFPPGWALDIDPIGIV